MRNYRELGVWLVIAGLVGVFGLALPTGFATMFVGGDVSWIWVGAVMICGILALFAPSNTETSALSVAAVVFGGIQIATAPWVRFSTVEPPTLPFTVWCLAIAALAVIGIVRSARQMRQAQRTA